MRASFGLAAQFLLLTEKEEQYVFVFAPTMPVVRECEPGKLH